MERPKYSPRLSRAEIRELGAAAGMCQQMGEMLARTNWAAAPACLTLLQHVLTAIANVYNRRERWLPENYPPKEAQVKDEHTDLGVSEVQEGMPIAKAQMPNGG